MQIINVSPLHLKLGPQPYLRAAGACLVSIQRSQRVTPRKLPNPYHTIILIFVNIIIKVYHISIPIVNIIVTFAIANNGNFGLINTFERKGYDS